jgi:hypothetical protein
MTAGILDWIGLIGAIGISGETECFLIMGIILRDGNLERE